MNMAIADTSGQDLSVGRAFPRKRAVLMGVIATIVLVVLLSVGAYVSRVVSSDLVVNAVKYVLGSSVGAT